MENNQPIERATHRALREKTCKRKKNNKKAYEQNCRRFDVVCVNGETKTRIGRTLNYNQRTGDRMESFFVFFFLSFCLGFSFSPVNAIGSERERTMKEEVKYLLTKKRERSIFIGIGVVLDLSQRSRWKSTQIYI